MKTEIRTINKEIERKYLLKDLPEIDYSEILLIDQFYIEEKDGKIYRIRFNYKLENNKLINIEYIHKEKIGFGENNEYHYDIDEETALELIKNSIKFMVKIRSIYIENNLKYEIDFMIKNNLLLLEIELPSIDYEFEIPEKIKEQIIQEVTGDTNYDNFNLANELPLGKTN